MNSKPTHSGRPLSKSVALLMLAWLIAVVGCLVWMTSYSNREGRIGLTPETWTGAMTNQEGTPVHQVAKGLNEGGGENQATILFFVHPRCPCTWASARQLKRTLSSNPKRLPTVLIYLFQPQGEEPSWGKTALAKFVGELPNGQAYSDFGGMVARKFNVMTSGTVIVYNSRGELEFSGGITSSRGHEGDSIGSIAIQAILELEAPIHRTAPIFGCELFESPTEDLARMVKTAG